MSRSSKQSTMDLRLVLVGLSGVGKSAAGNTILGREEFESDTSSSSVTLESEGREGEVCGRRVTVVDTPGLFNTELSGEKLREEMERSVSLCRPGPHAFLLVIQLGRFTQQEKRVTETLQELFSKRVDQHTMVLFTYGDKLRKITVEEFIRKDTNLQQLLQKCGYHYHVFNNEDMENRYQVTELLQKIDEMVAVNGGGCYTTEIMYRRAEENTEGKNRGILRESIEDSYREGGKDLYTTDTCRGEGEIKHIDDQETATSYKIVAGLAGGAGSGAVVGAVSGAVAAVVALGAAVGAGIGAAIGAAAGLVVGYTVPTVLSKLK